MSVDPQESHHQTLSTKSAPPPKFDSTSPFTAIKWTAWVSLHSSISEDES